MFLQMNGSQNIENIISIKISKLYFILIIYFTIDIQIILIEENIEFI